MNISAPFIHRPVATTLLTVAIALAGAVAFEVLPVSPLPEVDFPTISVSASLPGASAEIMASSVATPLERQLGHIAGVTEMTSGSTLGSTSVTIQFDLSRNIDAASQDIQAAIARAGGPSDFADKSRIFVLRQFPEFQRIRFTYDAIVRKDGGAAGFPLRTGDVIVIE